MPNWSAKLLIVDDELATRALLCQIFLQKGYPVRAAADGFAALEAIRAERPDILISDLNMPRMSGFELLSVVRRKLPEIYVIATSGGFSGDKVPHGIAADAFHAKATALDGLLEIVQSAAVAKPVRREFVGSPPIWISHSKKGNSPIACALLSCPECLRSFSLSVGGPDFVIRETECVHCGTTIHYATAPSMNPMLPRRFEPESTRVLSRGSNETVA